MLKITVELAPFGNEDEKRVLSSFVIHNIGRAPGLPEGVYRYKISKSLTDPATTFTHYRPDGLHKCVILGLEAAKEAGLDKTFLL